VSLPAQFGLFEAREELPTPETTATSGHVLRPYQVQAVAAARAALEENRSTLIVAATGTGKTAMFSEIARDWPGRVLMLAHRDELVQQGAHRLRQQTGRRVGIEKAEQYADVGAEIVVASVQTLCRDDRLARFGPDGFGLVIADEAHHYVAKSYRKILDYFATAKVLGVTATPDRGDRLALGQVFDSVASVYDIEDAIKDGFLCGIRATTVYCEDMSLEHVKTTAGDLNQGDLDAVMSTEKMLHEVAKPTIELAGGRRTLVFTTSVANAHRLAEVFCRYNPESARAVDGGMNLDVRRQVLADHQTGRFQFLVNVGIATEGYDDPAISCVVIGRPTKSRALYAQMCGRGTRIYPGKADLLILDMVGQAGRHKLVSAADILAGRYPDEVTELAKRKLAKEPGQDVRVALASAEEQIEREKIEAARRSAARAKVKYSTSTVNPFGVLGIHDPGNAGEWGGQFGTKPASEKQLQVLQKMKVPIPDNLSSTQASQLIGTLFKRRDKGLCTFGQIKVLKKFGYNTSSMSFESARRLIDAIAANGWKRVPLSVGTAAAERIPGEEG
jgi:superfamily II DNA or RNA helicase